MDTYRKLEDLIVYQKLCHLHIEVCDLTHRWPAEEKYELGSQARRSSNSSPAQIADKYDDRHIRNKIEGVNRSRGEAAETVHHLYMAHLKKYETRETFDNYRERYQECIRMLNGMERALERQLPEHERRWPQSVQENTAESDDACPSGYPDPEPRTPNPGALP
jgi:four helix bundle protein